MRTLVATQRYTADTYTYSTVDTIHDITATLKSLKQSDITQLALVSISLHFEEDLYSQERVEQSTRYFLDNLRSLVRKTDTVLLMNTSFHFILLGANLAGGVIVQERLWEALLWRVHNATDGDILRPYSMTIGHSAYPSPHEQALDCITAAHKPQQSFSAPGKPVHKYTTRQDRHSQKVIRESPEAFELPLLAQESGIPYLSLLPRKLPLKLRQLISPQLALELGCFPLGRERDTLTVAIANPRDKQVLDRLRQETGLRIFPVLAPPQELQTALEQLV
ncbi:hypothetical protein KSF_044560 [Reticulibacter mediterranei]|uniref:Type II secretion system protein GspE N-terminal domain-containing protein n=1 Tax=Reticulibacter mediterranei TaxID=2778369 RepID=A0A8J3IL43_9CHLR|nr:hypothetical protein [Reticulibacter mediterranei]GHO94408.1 hypothetical protein KSF_044560 [Reticulibacter mediterranei]